MTKNKHGIISEIKAVHDELVQWRRELHAFPELAFEESRTAKFVANKLQSWGICVTQGVGKTGVVGTLTAGTAIRSIGLRADMDALPMEEQNTFAHKSKNPGRMHGCGHDGHTTMLLAAARYLSQTMNFNGTVRFIFQPAEEANAIGSGAKAMIDDGLFERFPVDSVFAIHNAPGISVGTFSIRSGPVLASIDLFDVVVKGRGTHGAMPHAGTDTILVASHLITAWQSIVNREIDPLQSAVVSITSVQTGSSYNVIPEAVVIRGSVRSLSTEVQKHIHKRFVSLTHEIASAFGASADINYRQQAPATVNYGKEAEFANAIATDLVGEKNVLNDSQALRVMGSDDFAYLLREKPGAYILLGNGDGPSACMVHEAHYDFNDEILPVGASFFARIVECKMASNSINEKNE